MKLRVLWAVVALVAAGASAAHADVTYSFTTTSYGYVGPFPGPQQTGLPLQASVVLTNDTVRSGSFQLVGSFNSSTPPQTLPLFSTDSGSFVSVNIQGVVATPSSLFGAINLSLSFDGAGQITSSSIQGYTFSDEFVVSGPGSNIRGYLGSDNLGCNASAAQQVCAVSGFFSEAGFVPSVQPVPEPASVALLGVLASAACLCGTRRRAAFAGGRPA